ncbi:hypothetical protein CLOP_g9547 [Closterium sp. NIES-67]|nr:hypothetical protein CLOP_g9547 [Closterium sp. NIES-67]
MGCIQSKPAVKDPLPDGINEDGSGSAKFDETLQSRAKGASGRSIDDATGGKSASGRLPSLFSKSRRRDDQGDSTDDADDKGVEASPREATGIHCLPTGAVLGFKASQSSASATAGPAASPTSLEQPAAEEASTPVGSKLIRSKGKIEVMGFEVANVIVRAINLRQSLLERDIEDLRAEVLASEGIRMLVSDDFYHVWCIAAEDKRGELRAVARDVARLGKQCLDPALHSLTREFDALGTMEGPKSRMTAAEVEGELRALEGQAQVTAELYHELANLESLQQALDRRMKQDSDSAVNRELIAQMRAEIKAQEKIVKTMKKKGLWSKTMDEVVEKLVQVVVFLHDQIVDVFGADVVKLGVNGMALQYANIVNMIDTMVMRPACVETQREALYSALPASVCGRLKRTLLQSRDIEQESTDSIRQKMEAVLDWLVTMAENTIRYGLDSRVQGHTDLTLLQTLQHVDHLKMERLVLLLLVGLQHLASRSADHDWSPVPQGVLLAPVYAPRAPSPDRAAAAAAAAATAAAAAGSGGAGAGGDGYGGDAAAAAAAAAAATAVHANGLLVEEGEAGKRIISDAASAEASAASTAAASVAGAAASAPERSDISATDSFQFPVPSAAAAAAAAAGAAEQRTDSGAAAAPAVALAGEEDSAAPAAPAAAPAAGTVAKKAPAEAATEAEPALPPISLSLARRSISESVPTVGDWETLPRRIAAMDEETPGAAGDSFHNEKEGGRESGTESVRPGSAGPGTVTGAVAGSEAAGGSALAAAGLVKPDRASAEWRQLRQSSVSETSLEPVPEVEVMEGEEGEKGEGQDEEEEEEVHEKEKGDMLAPLVSATGAGGNRPSSSGGRFIPAGAAAAAAAAAGAGAGVAPSALPAADSESPAAAARRALASGVGTSRKSLENALRMGGAAGKRPIETAGAFGSPFDRTMSVGSAAGSSAAGSGPLAGEALLAAMTMSQGFGPAARGLASEEMMEAMREATYGRSRSHTFAMAARPDPNPRFFTKSLSRYSLARRMEAEEGGAGVGGGGGGGASASGVFVPPQRFLPMTPATLDVDRIHDVKPDLDLSSVATPRVGSGIPGARGGGRLV